MAYGLSLFFGFLSTTAESSTEFKKKKFFSGQFPGVPGVRMSVSLPGALGSIPSQATKIQQAAWHSPPKKR